MLGSEILILALFFCFVVDPDTLIANIACANRYRRRGLGLFAATHESDSVFIAYFFAPGCEFLLLEKHLRLNTRTMRPVKMDNEWYYSK